MTSQLQPYFQTYFHADQKFLNFFYFKNDRVNFEINLNYEDLAEAVQTWLIPNSLTVSFKRLLNKVGDNI